MSVCLKCNEQSLEFCLLAYKKLRTSILTFNGLHWKPIPEMRAFLVSIAADSHVTILVLGPQGKKLQRTLEYAGTSWRFVKSTLFFSFFTPYSPEPRFSVLVNFDTSLSR